MAETKAQEQLMQMGSYGETKCLFLSYRNLFKHIRSESSSKGNVVYLKEM